MADRRHACPGGCGRQILVHLLACSTDWKRLPGDLRKEVNIAYSHQERDPGRHRAAVAAAAQWFRDNERAPAGMVPHRRGKPNRFRNLQEERS